MKRLAECGRQSIHSLENGCHARAWSRPLVVLAIVALSTGWADSAHSQTFGDVPTDYWAFDFIETLVDSGITGGCGGGNYCPEDAVTRAQMAVFLERGINGRNYQPPPATGNLFLDVGANDFAAAFIEQLFNDGISGGCGGNNYCPNQSVTRAQMAVFLLRAKHGSGYLPPPASGKFDDVDVGYWAAAWVEQLNAEGITSGCSQTSYCPEQSVTRAQMAVFLVRAFALDQTNGPALQTSTPTSTGNISLTWSYEWGGGLASTANGYSLEESLSPSTGFSVIFSTVNGNDRETPKTYEFTRNEPGSYTLYYRVRARLWNQTWSDYSNVVAVSVTIDPQVNYTFPGGTLNDLRAVSPNLTFDDLTFAGGLVIPSSESNVVISVRNFTLNQLSNAVGVVVDYPTCSPYGSAPNLIINASADVVVNDTISLRGKSGTAIAEGATCNSPVGTDGGNFEVNAQNITINGRVDTSGGRSSTESMIIAGQVFRIGYDGRDAGNITFNATSNLSLTSNADLDAEGGSGGVGSQGQVGADGADGRIAWSGNPVNAAEIDALNALIYNAQRIPYGRLTITGSTSLADDAQYRDSTTSGWCQINYQNGFSDYLEDFYRIDLGGTALRSISVTTQSTSDIDIFLVDACPGNIISVASGISGNESFTSPLLNPGVYYLAVSYADDAPAGVTASYTVRLAQ
jgi:hypothetical protein